MNDILRTVNLSKKFRFTPVLTQLSLSVPEGSIYALVGPNGAGKTTCIKVLLNLLRPSSGLTEVLGRDSRKLSAADFAQIGYASENLELPEWMTVEYFLQYLKPFYPTWDDARAAELLRQFDLPASRKMKDLSRGMKMKAALASSLAYRPRLIVLDEPFTGLDPLVRDELVESLLANLGGATVFLSSHDLADIETFASHIGYLDFGSLKFSEELTSLQARFREVEVALAESPDPNTPPQSVPWPVGWLQAEVSPTLVRFIDTQFDEDRTFAEIRRQWSGIANISARPMPLRSIFVALAKTGKSGRRAA